MTRMTGGQALVKSVLAHGVDTIFALPGIQLDAFFNALHDEGNRVRVIHTRHEQGAAYMALGYALSTGRVGVFAVVPGPGVLNTTAALATAHATGAPVLCLTGQVPSYGIGRGLGLLHEIPDQLGILERLTKWSARIDHPAEIPGQVEAAFSQLRSGRRRPVALETPMDVLAQQAEIQLRDPPPVPAPPAPDAALIEKAAGILAAAERPMIMVGGGALDAAGGVRALAEALEAPVVALRSGRGVIGDRHYLSQPWPAGHQLWAEADAVLAIGTRLQVPRMEWGEDPGLPIIRVDIDPTEIKRLSRPAVGIVADAAMTAAALLEALARRDMARPSRRRELTALKEEWGAEIARLEPQVSYVRAIHEALSDDGFFVGDLTQVGYAAMLALPVHEPRHYINAGYQGTLGFGFATGLGVKVANPGARVVVVSGDGGFLFTATELATAVQHRIALVTIVFNDNAYGNVKRMQQHIHDGRVIATNLKNPDFVALAQSFGAIGLRASTPDELSTALARAFEEPGPTVIEVPIGEVPDPWHLVRLPRVRPPKAG